MDPALIEQITPRLQIIANVFHADTHKEAMAVAMYEYALGALHVLAHHRDAAWFDDVTLFAANAVEETLETLRREGQL